MAKLGQLIIELAANTARLQSDMGKAVGIVETGARKMGSAFKALGVVGGGGVLAAVLGNSVKKAIQLGDELQKASIKSGIGAKAISELAYAARLADVDLAALSTSIRKMQVTLSEASTGAKGPILALQALGLTIEQLQKRKPDEQFALLADRISQLKDPADRARAAVELFGKAGADLLPLFEQGAAGIAKARAEAQQLGLAFGDDQLQKLSAADDAMKRLNASWEGFWVTLSSKVAPVLSNILDGLSGVDTRYSGAKISGLEDELRGLRGQNFTPGSPDAIRRANMEAELARLRGLQELEQARAARTGTLGGPTGRTASDRGSVIGFAAADAAQKEAEKQGEFVGITADQYQDLYDDIGRMRDDALEEDLDREIERLKFYEEAERERQKIADEVAEFNREQADKLSEGAQIFKDTLMQGWSDWVHSGKIHVDEMLKYLVLAFTQRGLDKLLTSVLGGGSGGGADFWGGLFGGGGGGGGGGMGIVEGEHNWWGKVFGNGGWGSIFGGGRAAGGSVSAGKFYTVGEEGPELLLAGAAGQVIPHGGANMTKIAPVIHIDARGATADAIKLLPRMGKQISDEVEARIVNNIAKGNYGRLRR